MLDLLEADVAAGIAKPRNGIFAVRVFRAVEAPPREQAGQLRNSNPKELIVKNVVNALL